MKRVAPVTEMMEKLRAQEFKCALSGIQLHPETMEIDHIEAVEDGGSDEADNLHLVDSRVHSMRGTLTLGVFIDLCKRVASHHMNASLCEDGQREKDT